MSDYSFSGDDELPAATSKPLKAATTSTRGRKPPAAAAAAKTAPAPSTRRAKPAAAAKENPRSPLASNPPTRAAGVRSSGRGTGVGDENHRPDAGAVAAAGGKARGGTAAMNGHAAAGGANNAAAGGGGTHPKFKFAQRIVGGGAITTSELVKRMKELHSQLKAITQEEMADESLRAALMRPKKDLISTSLMMHKDKGVKVLAACSLAEILRLFAPDAPYTEAELRDIFEFFLKQLHNLSDPEHAYFENYHNLLDSLATVKSIILVTDINADELVIQYYKDFFDIVTVDMQKNVYDNILFVLQLLTEENNSISQDVVELIAYQFSHERKKANPRAFTLAVDLCNSCTDKLQKYICQYFSDVFVTASKAGRDGGASIDDFREAHDLVLEMNVHSHGVLLYVVPLLEEELRYDDVEVRRLATEVLGKMIAERGSRLTAAYGPVFRTWLERRNDNQSQIRILWIELCFPILKKHADMFAELIPHVAQKLQDPDEKVRLAVIKMVQALLKERDKKDLEASAWSNLTKDLLVQVGSRCRDKKPSIRLEAIKVLSRLFNVAYKEIVKPDDNYGAEKFGWIPGHLLDLLYLDDAEIKVLVEKSFSEEILPVDTDDAKRTDRLLKVVSAFSERQHAAFVSILERQAKTIQAMTDYLQYCDIWNNGVMDEADDKTEKVLKEIITFMSRNFPDPKRAYGHLMKFATVNDRMMYQLLRTIMDANSDYKTIIKNNKEVLKRLEPHGGLSETFSILLRRISLTNLGKSSVARLLEVTRIAKAADRSDKMAIMMGAVAEKLVSDISKTLPGVYKVHVNTLLELIKSEDLALVSESLGALSQFVKTSFGPFAFEGDAVDVMKKLALSGSRMDASRASTVLAKIVDPEPRIEVLNDIVDSFTAQAIDTAVRGGSIQNTRDEDDDEMDTLDRDDDEGVDARTKVVARLTSLGQLALYSPEIFEDHSSFLTDFLLKEILMKNRPNSPHQLHDDGAEVEWVTLDKLDVEGQLKVLAVKYYVKRLRGLAKVAENDAKASESKEDDAASMQVAITSSIPVYNMLNRILQRDGEIVKTDDTPALIRSHLVLVATISLIKLSSFAKYDLRLTPLDRCRLSLTIQDPKWQVRSPVIDKLRKLLSTREIPFQFHVLLMITAHEPDVEIKNKARTFLLRQAKLQRTAESNAATLEGEFTMLLYMLAHHPDFGTKDVEDINNSAKYIDFFLDIIATADNVSYLFHCAAQLKTVQDRYAPSSEGIYHLSDLAQYLIQDHCAQHGWSLPSYPASIPTNRELFKKLPTAEGAENFKINYLSKEWVTERQNMPHPPAPKRGRKSLDGAGSMTPLKGAQSPRSGAASPAGSDDEAPAPKRGRKKGTGATKKAPAKKAGGKGKGAGTRKPRATKKGKKNDNDDDEEEDEDEVMTDEVMADGTGADSDEEAPAKKGRAKGKGAGTRKPRATKKGKKNDEDDDEEEEEEDEVMADEVMADGAGADSEEPAPTKGTGRARRKGAATTRAPKPRTTKAKLSDDDDDDGDDDDALVDEPAAKKAKGGAAGKKSGDKNSSVPDSLIVSSGSDPGANAAMDVDDPDDDKKKRLRRGKRCAATFVVGD